MSWALHRDTLTHRLCRTHHIWHRWHSICPDCARQRARLTVDQLRAVADACDDL